MAKLAITEKWVREKTGVGVHQLSQVRSLFLPGAYAEKISHLGGALGNFLNLRKLDLSCNALTSLEGLRNLANLETLNLYFNAIPNLEEVFRLRHNQKLKSLDLRLNPVASEFPEYRLFVIHLLPLLQRLDDGDILGSERAAALEYFASDQAAEWSGHLARQRSPPVAPSSTREAQLRRRLALPPTPPSHTSRPRNQPPISGSGRRQIGVELDDSPSGPSSSMSSSAHTHVVSGGTRPRYRPSAPPAASTPLRPSAPATRPSPPFAPGSTSGREGRGRDSEAHARHAVLVTTAPPPNPADLEAILPYSEDVDSMLYNTAVSIRNLVESFASLRPSGKQQLQAETKHLIEEHLLQPLLQKHMAQRRGWQAEVQTLQTELCQAETARKNAAAAQSTLEFELAAVAGEVPRTAAESREPDDGEAAVNITRIRQRLQSLAASNAELLASVQAAEQDRSELFRQLDELQARESALDSELRAARDQLSKESRQALREQQRVVRERDELERDALAQESKIASLEEVVRMLQDSHQSLAQSNEHLMAELRQEKTRHRKEVEQLRWNYNELKRTSGLLAAI